METMTAEIHKTVYLVDYENVNESGLYGIRTLDSDDPVYLIVSPMIRR